MHCEKFCPEDLAAGGESKDTFLSCVDDHEAVVNGEKPRKRKAPAEESSHHQTVNVKRQKIFGGRKFLGRAWNLDLRKQYYPDEAINKREHINVKGEGWCVLRGCEELLVPGVIELYADMVEIAEQNTRVADSATARREGTLKEAWNYVSNKVAPKLSTVNVGTVDQPKNVSLPKYATVVPPKKSAEENGEDMLDSLWEDSLSVMPSKSKPAVTKPPGSEKITPLFKNPTMTKHSKEIGASEQVP
jgi:hypothetical protein